ncbi:MAG: universal stress protein, partial [Longimicrobiales bacterium]
PLIHFTSDRRKMGKFANPAWVKVAAWTVAAIIIALNLALVVGVLGSWLDGGAAWLWLTVILSAALLVGILGYLVLAPLFGHGRVWESGVVTTGHVVASRIKPVRYRHIGVAVEHREGDADVISSALALVAAHKARMTLLHVTETPGTMVYGAEEASLHGREDQAYLEELAREVEERDVSVETSLRYGTPVEEIVKAVDEDGYDLLILGSHGHRGLGDIVFGQTVSSVRHSVEIPVMVVRTHPAERERAQRGDSGDHDST